MRNPPILAMLMLMGIVLACSFPMFATDSVPTLVVPSSPQEETTTPIATAVATASGPAPLASAPALLLVTATPVPVIVATPTVPMVTPNAVNVNCRSGPDLAYDSVSTLAFGSSTQVTGRTADSSWWYVQDPNNPTGNCWISASVVTISGPTGGIPVAALPAAIVTRVTVAVAAPSISTCGGPNPVTFSGTITTNGAATVTYQWEITGSQTNTTSPQTLAFTGGGTQNVAGPGTYNVDCGNYTVTLHVTNPNNLRASKTFTVQAP